jgi:hypothetical protein
MNKRNQFFDFRINDIERQMLGAVAEVLERTKSDTLRLLIRHAAQELVDQKKTTHKSEKESQNDE